MQILKEFRDFAIKGNVVDLAIGIIMGTAFGKIISSLVTDVLMPPLGVLIGGVNFTDLTIILKHQNLDGAGKIINPAITLNYGRFLQSTLDFTLVAIAIFILVQGINRLKQKQIATEVAPGSVSKMEILVGEIRDILKSK
jgi:large conductance mechanosensitive channel